MTLTTIFPLKNRYLTVEHEPQQGFAGKYHIVNDSSLLSIISKQ